MRWVKKYLKLLSKYSEQYEADVGNVWHSDEMTINIKKKGEKGYREWIWNVMDAKTRYLLACTITKDREITDARKPLQDAKGRSNKRPDIIVTDGLQAYRSAIQNEFYDNKEYIRNPHLRLKDFQTRPNNNIVERLNGTYRERLKVMRGLNDPVNANEFVEGMRVYYNYIRPHQALNGLTPSQIAHIPIDLDGNRWLKMIEPMGSKWRVIHQFQIVKCRQECGKEFWCRSTHIVIGNDEGWGHHNNYEKNIEDFNTVRTENLTKDGTKYVTEVQRDGKWTLETNDGGIFGRLKEW